MFVLYGVHVKCLNIVWRCDEQHFTASTDAMVESITSQIDDAELKCLIRREVSQNLLQNTLGEIPNTKKLKFEICQGYEIVLFIIDLIFDSLT